MSYFCYLLESRHPRASRLGGRTYIGFTVNPSRRKRQHNGEISNGAFKTRKWRPWEMVVVVGGFANQRTALQFEWTWQHGEMSLDTREAMGRLQGMVEGRFQGGQRREKKVGGGGGVMQVLRLVAMLSTGPWKYFPLEVRVASGPLWRLVGDALRMLGEGRVGGDMFLVLPEHVGVSVGPVEDYLAEREGKDGEEEGEEEEEGKDEEEDEEEEGGRRRQQLVTPSPGKVGRKDMKIRCLVCLELAQRTWSECVVCGGRVHVGCLAAHYLEGGGASGVRTVGAMAGGVTDLPRQPACLPDRGACPHCQVEASWGDVLARLKTAGWRKNNKGAEEDEGEREVEVEGKENSVSALVSSPTKKKTGKKKTGKKAQGTAAAAAVAGVVAASTTTPVATTPLEALIRRTEMLHIDGDDVAEESLASRMLRRLQEEGEREGECGGGGAPADEPGPNMSKTKEPTVIDLCSESEEEQETVDTVDDVVHIIDLASDD